MSTILVTGALGFIGSAVADEMERLGWSVIRVDRELPPPQDGDPVFVAANLMVPGAFDDLLGQFRPDVVLHMAAIVGRLIGDDDPRRTIEANTFMTMDAAKACGSYGATLVYASTSEVYGDTGGSDVREGSPMVIPNNLYGLTKRWGEEACHLYHPGSLQILRPSMPYGPGQPLGRGRIAINNMIWQAATRQQITVHRGAERCWCWIGDMARAVGMIIERGEVHKPGARRSTGVFNVGRDDKPVAMELVAKLACDIAGAPRDLISVVEPPKNVTPVKRLVMDKVRELGWAPLVEIEQGMRTVHDSYAQWPLPPA